MIVEQGKHHAVGLTQWFQGQYKERCLTEPMRLRAAERKRDRRNDQILLRP